MNNHPLLSLCIPTFNRAGYLRKSLESIVSQKAFAETDDVEIIVSDNCSTDETSQVVAEFVARFNGKIPSSRNDRNVSGRPIWRRRMKETMDTGDIYLCLKETKQ